MLFLVVVAVFTVVQSFRKRDEMSGYIGLSRCSALGCPPVRGM